MHKRPNSTLTPSSQTDFRRFYIWLLSAKFKCLQEHCSGRSLWASERYVKQSKKSTGETSYFKQKKTNLSGGNLQCVRTTLEVWLACGRQGRKYRLQIWKAICNKVWLCCGWPTNRKFRSGQAMPSFQAEEWHSVELIDECNFFGQYTKIVLSYFPQITQVSFEVVKWGCNM